MVVVDTVTMLTMVAKGKEQGPPPPPSTPAKNKMSLEDAPSTSNLILLCAFAHVSMDGRVPIALPVRLHLPNAATVIPTVCAH